VTVFDMDGPTALITGGSSGIGFAIATDLVKLNFNVILLARRKELLEKAKAELEGIAPSGKVGSSDQKIATVSADVSSVHSLKIAEENLRRSFDRIDLLVNCAGVVKPAKLDDLSDEEILNQIQINLLGMMLATRQFLKYIPENGSIVNFSSALGLFGLAGYTAYSASKFGVVGFSDALRRELLSKRISVHVVCPPDVDTPQFKKEHEDMPEWMRTKERPKALPASLVSRRVISGVKHGKFLILPDISTRFLDFMLRFFPRLSRWILDGMFPKP